MLPKVKTIWKRINQGPKIIAFILGSLFVSFSFPAEASYTPFNTSVNMNVGIGTSTPQGALVITNGNVGIGTWVPISPLTVAGGAGGTDWITLNRPAAEIWGINASNNNINFIDRGSSGAGSNNRFTFTTAGNLGIGSLSPGQALDVNGTTRTTNFTLSGQSPANGFVLTATDSSGDATWSSAGSVNGWTVSGNNVYETNSGNVGIGTTSVTQGALVITNGNVGIGTWVANQTLVVDAANPEILVELPSHVAGVLSVTNTGVIMVDGTALTLHGAGGFLQLGGGAPVTGFAMENSGSSSGFPNIGVSNSSVSIGDRVSGTTQGGAGNIVFYTGASDSTPAERVRINTSGNVGIGTINQLSKLNVNGGVGIGTSLTNGAYLNGNSAPSGGLIVQGNVGIGTFNPLGGGLIVLPANTGNVGIGSLTPGQVLDVQGTTRTANFTMSGQSPANGFVLTATDSSGDGTWSSAGGVSGWTVSGNNVYETNSGNVGIGTTAITQGALVVTNGNVGIGTWVPIGSLQIADTSQGTSNYDLWAGPTGFTDLGGWISGGDIVKNVFATDAGSAATLYTSLMGWTRATQAADLDATGVVGEVSVQNTTGTVTAAFGLQGQIDIGAAGNQTNAYGVQGSINKAGSGTLTNAFGVNASSATKSAGTITNVYGVYGNNQSVGTNNYNIYINQTTAGAKNYALYSAGTAQSYYAGNVGIGSLTPVQALDVQGTTRTTNLTMTGQSPANGFVLTATDSSGDATWTALGGVTGWTVSGNNVFKTSSGNVGIGTTSVTQGAVAITNGNVGIGTWAPSTTLQVIGKVQIGIPVGSPGTLDIHELNDNSAEGLRVVNATNATSSRIWADTFGGHLSAGSGDTLPILINSANAGGNVGIGTFLPSGVLEVGTQDLDVLSNGNVGVGSIHPGQLLDVQGTTRTTNFELGGQSPANGFVLTATDSAGDTTWSSAGGVAGWTVSGNNVYETNGGNVGIGTTLTTTSALTVMNGNVGIGTWVPTSSLSVAGTGGDITHFKTSNQTVVVKIDSSGNVGIGTTITGNAGMTVMNGNVGIGTWKPIGTFQIFQNTASGVLLVDANGNLGLGTTSPQAGLAVTNGNVGIGTWTAAGGNLIINGGGNVGIGSAWPGFALDVNGGGRFTSAGNVGIATSNPGKQLDIGSGGMRVVGIGTTVPQEICRCSDGAFGYFNGTWNGQCICT
jgi:hypothetical protein